ncbi:MAG: hypothetical protein J0L84_05870 [Verrucomicrobia bacterium]|nr:hypothetical protein [Verrucomicrobiota bacterium]
MVIPAQPADPVQLLTVQRSAALFRASTRERRHSARVIIYGQSTSQQWWAWELLRELPAAFPAADLKVKMQAISAFNADYLIQTAEADIYPLLPDLIIFQCYGPYGVDGAWRRFLRELRRRTTADIILLGNHPLQDGELVEPTDPARIDPVAFPATHGEAWVNYVVAPAIARELGLCNPDNRSLWKRYILANGLRTSSLLNDVVHFNEHGSDLLKAILKPYLRAECLSPGIDPFNNSRVWTHPVWRGGLQWSDGRLRLPFVGNRVDLVAGPGLMGSCRVLVDGKPPTEWPGGTGHLRSGGWKGEFYSRPAILKVGATVPLVAEKWTLTVTEMNPADRSRFAFTVEGSVTGPDGAGVSTERFVSPSGRVIIETNSWNIRIMPAPFQQGAQVVWNSEIRGVDLYRPVPPRDPRLETTVNLVHDLPDGPHVVELIAEDPLQPPPVAALRVYHPGGGLPGSELPPGSEPVLRCLRSGSHLVSAWPASWGELAPLLRRGPGNAWGPLAVEPVELPGLRAVSLPMDGDFELLRLDGP